MPFYYDQEDRQRSNDEIIYRSTLRPKVSDAEACKSIPLTNQETEREEEMKKRLAPLPPHEIFRPTLGYGTTKRVWIKAKDDFRSLGVGNTLAEARADARAKLAATKPTP